MKRNNIIYIVSALMIILHAGCKKFLDYSPKGVVTLDILNTPEQADKLVIAAYASLGNDFGGTMPISNMWLYGAVRSDDAYKGGGSIADGGGGQLNALEQYNLVTTDMARINDVWTLIYSGIARVNTALRQIEKFDEAEYSKKKERVAEMRFVRGHYWFLLKTLFKYVPLADESFSDDSLKYVSNRQYSNDQGWEKIANEFQYAVDNLPEPQAEIGRASKLAAYAYLAKVRLYQAYEQNDQNKVISINQAKLNDVVSLIDNVINSGKYALSDDFAKNFMLEYENGKESIFAIQFSLDDGTEIGRLNMGSSHNYSLAPGYGCCGWSQPSQNLVNAFKTDLAGLPMFDTFNISEMKNPADFLVNGVDPRLDHTVGISGHPYKYKSTFVYSASWARTPTIYGPYSTMKEMLRPDDPGLRKVGPFFGTAKNSDIIRYADVLLWKAEALIELGRQNEALPLINQLRVRARNSTGRLKKSDGTDPSNYRIETYVDGVNCTWTQDFARKALQWERRLEFAMESPRFFDLVRWGIAAETLNGYLAIEKTRHSYLNNAFFTKGRDEYLPIPQDQINLTEGLYKQNNGW
ncbi:RagB/SusD family nutrient uptake outer membrane protein [Terrimonas alba]|uniref:RagB/SusD family nutrient uptake outer membrane protein n=1 Tax=Terrimonas alba TaxID=3349636 RepID=UPI0035F44BCB